MDVCPSWRGPAGMALVILIALPMQNDIGAGATPLAGHQSLASRPAPSESASSPSPAGTITAPTITAPAMAAEPATASPGVTLVPAAEVILAGIFTARVEAWDASAAAVRMDQRQAMRHLAKAGLTWKSTGGCADRRRPVCTSLQSIRYGTLMQVIDLKRASGCAIMITGGTEAGHAGGRYSHRNGFKLDIAHNRCIDAYIRGRFRRWKSRTDGATLYRPPPDPGLPSGPDEYADEPTHWDILFR